MGLDDIVESVDEYRQQRRQLRFEAGSAASGPGAASESSSFRLHERIGRGGQGEVWRGLLLRHRHTDPSAGGADAAEGEVVVLKRMLPRVRSALWSWRREVHYGRRDFLEALGAEGSGDGCTTRLIDFFERAAAGGGRAAGEHWLVFRDDGVSLQHLFFVTGAADARGAGVLQPSPYWVRLYTPVSARPIGAAAEASAGGSAAAEGASPLRYGHTVLRSILRQTASALALLHAHNVTHRDVKLGNILAKSAAHSVGAGAGSGAGAGATRIKIRLADFGSAVDPVSEAFLYPPGQGATVAEATLDYAPPEVRAATLPAAAAARCGRVPVSAFAPFFRPRPHVYDSFSLGVVWLEMLTGQPASVLFQPPARAESILRRRLGEEADSSATGASGESDDPACDGEPGGGGEAPETVDVRDARLQAALAATGFARFCIVPGMEGYPLPAAAAAAAAAAAEAEAETEAAESSGRGSSGRRGHGGGFAGDECFPNPRLGFRRRLVRELRGAARRARSQRRRLVQLQRTRDAAQGRATGAADNAGAAAMPMAWDGATASARSAQKALAPFTAQALSRADLTPLAGVEYAALVAAPRRLWDMDSTSACSVIDRALTRALPRDSAEGRVSLDFAATVAQSGARHTETVSSAFTRGESTIDGALIRADLDIPADHQWMTQMTQYTNSPSDDGHEEAPVYSAMDSDLLEELEDDEVNEVGNDDSNNDDDVDLEFGPDSLLTEHGFDLLFRLLQFDPRARISAAAALRHPFFQE
jgi:serine/threonine protein kinase